jgi:uncharacterized protein YegP (UPF0339 family)
MNILLRTATLLTLLSLVGFTSSLSAQPKSKASEKYEVYKDSTEEFRWRLKASNGTILATGGQGYKAKADAIHAIELLQKEAAKAKSTLKTETYKDTKGDHRWRIKASNGSIIAVSSEGYKNEADLEKALELVKGAGKAEVVDLTKE